MTVFSKILLCSLDQYKYVCAIPVASLWKLEIAVVATTTTVIATNFQFPCQRAALLHYEYRTSLALQEQLTKTCMKRTYSSKTISRCFWVHLALKA